MDLLRLFLALGISLTLIAAWTILIHRPVVRSATVPGRAANTSNFTAKNILLAILFAAALGAAGIFLSQFNTGIWRDAFDIIFALLLVLSFIGLVSLSQKLGWKVSVVGVCILAGIGLLAALSFPSLVLFLKTNTLMAAISAFAVFASIGMAYVIAIMKQGKAAWQHEFFFAFLLGTVITWILISAQTVLFSGRAQADPFFLGLGIIGIALAWRFLFGAESPFTKACVMGTFLFWIGYRVFKVETFADMPALAVALCVCVLTMLIACLLLFWSRWKQRPSVTILALFGGMLSTAPIAFYHALVSHGSELNFFLFRVSFQSIPDSAHLFISRGALAATGGVQVAVLSSIITYLLVGIVEEGSKFWVLRKCSDVSLSSINDFLQMAILIAIGFGFAENIANRALFADAARQYLLDPTHAQIGFFLLAVLVRTMTITMVHALSTGILGYHFGLAYFGNSLLQEQERSSLLSFLSFLQRITFINPDKLYRIFMICRGLVFAIIIHGLFDFIMSLLEIATSTQATDGPVLLFGIPFTAQLMITLASLCSMLYLAGGAALLHRLLANTRNERSFGARTIKTAY